VISIKKFLATENAAEPALRHGIRLLIQGIAQHAIPGDTLDGVRFRESLQKISDALTEHTPPDEILVHTESVLKALEEYNRRTARTQALHATELHLMVTMLTSTVSAISTSGDVNVKRLGEIEKRVVSTSQLDDVRVIKGRLSDCLADIRSEVDRQRQDQRATIQQLNDGLDAARKTSPNLFAGPSTDPITGLARRAEAEIALAEAGQADAPAFAVVLVLDRLQALNLKFGREVGDEVLGEFARMIEKKLPYGDQLFRWGGPSLLAILHRRSSIERVRSEIAQMVDIKLEHNIETPSRSIMIPIAARWAVFPMMAAPRLLYKRIDTFSAVLMGRDWSV
jgi:diguanylate cyclase (GGDEF)-like protein